MLMQQEIFWKIDVKFNDGVSCLKKGGAALPHLSGPDSCLQIRGKLNLDQERVWGEGGHDEAKIL